MLLLFEEVMKDSTMSMVYYFVNLRYHNNGNHQIIFLKQFY